MQVSEDLAEVDSFFRKLWVVGSEERMGEEKVMGGLQGSDGMRMQGTGILFGYEEWDGDNL